MKKNLILLLLIFVIPCLGWHTKDVPRPPECSHKKYKITKDLFEQAMGLITDSYLAEKLSFALQKYIDQEFCEIEWDAKVTEAYVNMMGTDPSVVTILTMGSPMQKILLITRKALRSSL
jgi:hypothetical protein